MKRGFSNLKTKRAVRWPILLICLAALVSASCGGDDSKDDQDLNMKLIREKEAKLKARREKSKETAATDSPDALVKVRLNNHGWRQLAVHFKKYIDRGLKVRMSTDVFRPHAAAMLPRPKLRFPSEQVISNIADGTGRTKEKPKARFPLQEYSLSELRVVLIMSNTSRPKAIVVDPKGVSYTITATPPTKIGNANGFVTRISQYDVLVRENDQIKRLNSLKPMYFDLRKGILPPKSGKTPSTGTATTAGAGNK